MTFIFILQEAFHLKTPGNVKAATIIWVAGADCGAADLVRKGLERAWLG